MSNQFVAFCQDILKTSVTEWKISANCAWCMAGAHMAGALLLLSYYGRYQCQLLPSPQHPTALQLWQLLYASNNCSSWQYCVCRVRTSQPDYIPETRVFYYFDWSAVSCHPSGDHYGYFLWGIFTQGFVATPTLKNSALAELGLTWLGSIKFNTLVFNLIVVLRSCWTPMKVQLLKTYEAFYFNAVNGTVWKF